MSPSRSNLTDRAKRYRAQNAVRGERRCVLCNARGRLDVMHLDGNESNGEPQNLAHGCRSCNGKLAAAFKRIGAGVPTNQYNPSKGGVPTFQQYVWAVTQHSRGAHDEGGVVIHATPKSKRIEYARRIADLKASRHNLWPFSSKATSSGQTLPASARSASRYESPRTAVREKSLSYKGYRLYGSDQAGWRTSLGSGDSVFDSEKDVKAFITSWNRKNPKVNPGSGAFERCVQKVEAKGGAYDPRAVCAAAGRKKYGAKKFAAMAQAGKRKAARNVDPTTAAMLGEEFVKIGSKLKKKATGNPQFFLVANESGQRPPVSRHYDRDGAEAKKDKLNAQGAKGGPFAVFIGDPDYFARVGYGMKRLNPADAAAEMFQKFHGRPSGEVVEVRKDLHYHGNLAALGELEKLTVKANDGGLVDLEGFGDAVLCSNERGTQLYIEGGDQAVKLSAFGIGKPYHDVEDLGEVTKLWYFTTKDHLGDQGGEASYHHTLSEERKTRMFYGFGERRAPKPRLLYDVLNQALAFAGGEYSVEPEGIRN